MKNVLIKTRIFAIALTATIATSFYSPVQASDEKKEIPVELKFLGIVEEYPVFQLNFSGAEEEEYTIIIRDEFSNVLYKDKIKAVNFSRNFTLKIEGLENTDIRFEILSKKGDSRIVYAVCKKLHTTEDLLITQVK
ncbi:MAG: hypothetical protein ACSLE0_13065 [Chitinophagaceae bacterium]